MGLIQLSLIAVGLAMDAFAVSVCKGLRMRRVDLRYACLLGGLFGGFQAMMPVLGWLLGRQFAQYIERVDHWIAFLLLGLIGGKMALDSRRPDADEECGQAVYNLKELLALSVATSIDALAVGVTFAFLGVDILLAAALIGAVTFALSVAGVAVGCRFGARFKSRAELAGGLILIGIGLKILLEHLGLLG